MIFNMGGGGAALNFKVVGGTTQPSNPRENTIWVNTDKTITEWAFAIENPYTEAIEGAVWIKTSYTSTAPINILKKNNVTVFPNCAYQYVDGELISKDVLVYKNGYWVELEVVLYNEGFDNYAITGGWIGSKTEGILHLTSISGEGVSESSTIYTENKIDLSSFSVLTCDFKNLSVAFAWVFISTTQDESGKVAEKMAVNSNSDFETITLDISDLNESYYVVFNCKTVWDANGSFTVSKVALK